MKVVVLDRDGVINKDSDAYIKSPSEWHPLPGSIKAISNFSSAGYRVFVATNQSGLARGLFATKDLVAIHEKMEQLVSRENGKIDGIFYCPHSPTENCDCRKPKTGLLKQIEKKLGFSLAGSPFIGDSVKDIQAALEHGCRPILVKTGNGCSSLRELTENGVSGFEVHSDLAEAATKIINVPDS